VAPLDEVKAARLVDRLPARALGVSSAVVSRYRGSGVPDHQASRLGQLSR
jgi:hypothetical protein